MAEASDETPEIGHVRVTSEGEVEYYDGTAYRPYEELPDDDPNERLLFRREGPVHRHEP